MISPELLKMAGLYSVWTGQDGTCSVQLYIIYCVWKFWNGPELLRSGADTGFK
jgi:hypothetical protein